MSYYRKIIRITADDSPNVIIGKAYAAAGMEPPAEMVVEGVLPYADYINRKENWDNIRQTIGLYALFYEGAETLLFPPQWLDRAAELDKKLKSTKRIARGVGIDPAEGGDKTSMSAVDEFGLIEMISKKTPDTDVIPREAIAFWQRHKCEPQNVIFDRGGGGKQAADRLRGQGHQVRTVGFGESVIPEEHRLMRRSRKQRIEDQENRYECKNRRMQMYYDLRQLMDPVREQREQWINYVRPGFAIPDEYVDIRKQLAPLPLLMDEEGRLFLPPKRKKGNAKKSTIQTLEDIIGKSPDEADSLVLAVHAMIYKKKLAKAGVLW